MKPILLLLLSFLFFSFMGGNKKKNDLERDNIKGKVKTIVNYTYLNQSNKKDSLILIDSSWYNKQGFNLKLDGFSAKGVLLSRIIPIKRDSVMDAIEDSDISWQQEPFEVLIHGNKAPLHRHANLTKEKYDKNGNLKSMAVYLPNGSLEGGVVLLYDSNGNNIGLNQYDHYYNKTSYNKYTIDESGLVIEDDLYNQKDSIVLKTHKSVDKLDKMGNWVKRTYTANGRPTNILIRKIEYYP